MTSTKYQNI